MIIRIKELQNVQTTFYTVFLPLAEGNDATEII